MARAPRSSRRAPPPSRGRQAGEIDEAAIERALDTHDLPPLDLLIRTSGEHRLSNFLLWQAAYAELLFVDTLWPDFDGDALRAALADYAPARAPLRRAMTDAPPPARAADELLTARHRRHRAWRRSPAPPLIIGGWPFRVLVAPPRRS